MTGLLSCRRGQGPAPHPKVGCAPWPQHSLAVSFGVVWCTRQGAGPVAGIRDDPGAPSARPVQPPPPGARSGRNKGAGESRSHRRCPPGPAPPGMGLGSHTPWPGGSRGPAPLCQPASSQDTAPRSRAGPATAVTDGRPHTRLSKPPASSSDVVTPGHAHGVLLGRGDPGPGHCTFPRTSLLKDPPRTGLTC